jgi:nucleoside-diphosphate-sugar epimerase
MVVRTASDSADVLVLGSSGFVGSAIVAEAKARGLSVHEVSRETYRQGLAARWVINANGNSKKYLARERPRVDFDLSVRSVVDSLHDFSCERYCFLSTIDVYDDVGHPTANDESVTIRRERLSTYGLHKLIAEDLVRHATNNWVILRMGGFVGPGLKKNSIHDLLTGKLPRVHPESRYQYQHTRALATTALDLLANGVSREIFNVAGNGTMSLREIAALIPNARLPDPQGTPECYEVSTAKLATLRSIPPTLETVESFIRDVLAGRESLG